MAKKVRKSGSPSNSSPPSAPTWAIHVNSVKVSDLKKNKTNVLCYIFHLQKWLVSEEIPVAIVSLKIRHEGFRHQNFVTNIWR